VTSETFDLETPILQVDKIVAGYGKNAVLHDVSLTVGNGEVVTLIGANGAGKTTLMSTLLGRITPTSGDIVFQGSSCLDLPIQERVRKGLVLVPEGREPLKPLTVEENLLVARQRERGSGAKVKASLEEVYDLFPRLAERKKQQAGSMSGGEQQMLAIGRAIMSKPTLLLLDEPSLGLAPTIVDRVFEALTKLRQTGLSMLLVEQDAFLALDFADRGYVLETGSVVLDGPARDLAESEAVRSSYLGMG
jgi:branched-chain amino acid transport system ATP-binding protein